MLLYKRQTAKTDSYLLDDRDETRKSKGTIKCVIKRKLKFEDCKHCSEATQIEKKINQIEKNISDVVRP